MIEQLLEKAKRRVDAAEVFALDDTTMELSFEAGKLKNAEHKVFSGLGLRVIHNGRLGFSSTTDPGTLFATKARRPQRRTKDSPPYHQYPNGVEEYPIYA